MKPYHVLGRWFAACAIIFVAGPLHAQDTVIASATLQVTGLQYRLVDLDPNDGITPWVSFTDANNTLAEVRELRDPPSVDIKQTYAGAFPALFTLTSPSGLAQVTRTFDGFTVHAEVRRSDLDDASVWPTKPYRFLAQRAAVLDISSLSASLSLSPHTQLIIEGQITSTVTLDVSSLSNLGLIQDPLAPITGLHGRSTLYLFHSAYEENGDQLHDGAWHLSLDQDVSATGAGSVVTDALMPPSLSFGLVNTRGAPLTGRVSWGSAIYAGVFGTGVDPVPEPEVLALVLAGLCVVSLANASRKSKYQGNLPSELGWLHESNQGYHV